MVTTAGRAAVMTVVQLQVPEGNVRVPIHEFELVWTDAERLFRDDPQSRYIGGVCAACRWVAGHPDALSPLHGTKVRANEESIARENVLANMTYLGVREGDPLVDLDWAAGVALTLGWVRGVLPHSPVGGSRRT
jgi:hypothetical protein